MADYSRNVAMGIRCAADIIRNGKRGVVLSGAGISTPSGIPDFRSTEGGLWQIYDPFEVASLEAFRYHPERFYEWMHPLAGKIQHAEPNPAHKGVADLEASGHVQTVITQNIDSLHQKGGSRHVIEVHGSLGSLTCTRCYHQVPSVEYLEAYLLDRSVPHCPICQAVLKPNLILFGEQLPRHAWQQAERACAGCDFLLVAGSSLEVLPVASLPMRAVENGAHLIIVNKSVTYLDVRADVVLHQDLIEIIPQIAALVNG